jgi:hypothetical protein
MEADGIFIKQYRHMHSVIYWFADIFKDWEFKIILRTIIPGISLISYDVSWLYASVLEKSLHDSIKDNINNMLQDKIAELTATLQLNNDQRKTLSGYPVHILDYAWQKTLKNQSIMNSGSQLRKINYLIAVCKSEFARKKRPYDPLSAAEILKPVDKSTIAGDTRAKKDQWWATTTTAPESKPTLAPPPVFKPDPKDTTEDIIRYVADNFGLAQATITEGGKTTNLVLSDMGIGEKKQSPAAQPLKPRSTTDVRKEKSAHRDVEGRLHVVNNKHEDGLQAFAQLMMATAPIIKETVKEELLRDMHTPKHATVDDLLIESMKPHIQNDGADKDVLVPLIDEDDQWFALQSAPVDMDEWLY